MNKYKRKKVTQIITNLNYFVLIATKYICHEEETLIWDNSLTASTDCKKKGIIEP